STATVESSSPPQAGRTRARANPRAKAGRRRWRAFDMTVSGATRGGLSRNRPGGRDGPTAAGNRSGLAGQDEPAEALELGREAGRRNRGGRRRGGGQLGGEPPGAVEVVGERRLVHLEVGVRELEAAVPVARVAEPHRGVVLPVDVIPQAGHRREAVERQEPPTLARHEVDRLDDELELGLREKVVE